MTTYVSYARVSTDKQGRSGLGLEAQEAAIQAFLRPGDTLLSPTYVEVESGKRADRPELDKAIAHTKLTRATLLVAKLDRLSRDTRFLLNLIHSGVDVAFGDLPHVEGAMGKFILTQMAAVAELEAGLTSQRTKAALQAAKARGKKLGGFRGVKVDPAAGLEARQAAAGSFKAQVAPKIEAAQAQGITSAAGIARTLNEQRVPTRRGGTWTAQQVQRVMA
jgi:DNA invertase Pin-like site-specific DNA recombinase